MDGIDGKRQHACEPQKKEPASLFPFFFTVNSYTDFNLPSLYLFID